MKTHKKFGINHDIGYNILKVSLLFKRNLLKITKKYNTTPEQISVILALTTKPSLIQKEIGILTFQDPPALSRTIERMKQNGFIVKSKNTKDKRATAIEITAKGKTLSNQIPRRLKKRFNKLLNVIPHRRKKILVKLLVELRQALGG